MACSAAAVSGTAMRSNASGMRCCSAAVTWSVTAVGPATAIGTSCTDDRTAGQAKAIRSTEISTVRRPTAAATCGHVDLPAGGETSEAMMSPLRTDIPEWIERSADVSVPSQQLVEGDRQVEYAFAGGVPDGVGHGRGGPGDGHLPDSEQAQWHGGVRLVEVVHVDVWDVGVYGHVVFGQARIHDPAGAVG